MTIHEQKQIPVDGGTLVCRILPDPLHPRWAGGQRNDDPDHHLPAHRLGYLPGDYLASSSENPEKAADRDERRAGA